MRTRNRLKALQKWAQENLCAGREMKAPGEELNIGDIHYKEPDCYIGWMPQRMNAETGDFEEDYLSVSPSITIMFNPSKAKSLQEKRFDRYSGVHRPREMGQTLSVTMLFSVYEPGIRLPGFAESADRQEDPEEYGPDFAQLPGRGLDMSLIREGTEEGLFTLTDWMDECMEKLLAAGNIPGSDLFVNEESIVYSLYNDQNFVVDKRPLYYGYINVEFSGHAKQAHDSEIQRMLD